MEIFDTSAKIKKIYDEKREKKAKKTKYPWRDLDVGKSFAVTGETIKFSSLVTLAYKTGVRLNRKFVVMEHSPGMFEVARFADPIKDEKKDEKKTTFWEEQKVKEGL